MTRAALQDGRAPPATSRGTTSDGGDGPRPHPPRLLEVHGPEHPKHEPGNPFEKAIRDYYRVRRREIGELLEHLTTRRAVLVVSDHGAKRIDGGICFNEWLMHEGLLALKSNPSAVTLPPRSRSTGITRRPGRTAATTGASSSTSEGREPNGRGRSRRLRGGARRPRGDGWRDPRRTSADGDPRLQPDELYARGERRRPGPDRLLRRPVWRSVGRRRRRRSIYTLDNDTGPDDANHAQHGIIVAAGAGAPARLARRGSLDIAPTGAGAVGARRAGGHARAEPRGKARGMNLVVWVADALRVDHVGCYGARQVATPTIDELAAGCDRPGDQRRAATAPSTASMVIGLYLDCHGDPHCTSSRSSRPDVDFVAAAYGDETGSSSSTSATSSANSPTRTLRARASGRRSSSGFASGVEAVPPLFHSWTMHMPYGVLHRSARSGAGEGGRHRRHRVRRSGRVDAFARATARPSSVSPSSTFAGSQALDDLDLREQIASRSSPTTASRGVGATRTSRRGRARTTCTARISTTRSSACAVLFRAGRVGAGRLSVAGEPRRPHADDAELVEALYRRPGRQSRCSRRSKR